MAGRNNKAGAGRTGGGAAGAAKQLSPDQYKAASAAAKSRATRARRIAGANMDDRIDQYASAIPRVRRNGKINDAARLQAAKGDRGAETASSAVGYLKGRTKRGNLRPSLQGKGYRAPSSRIY